MQTPVKGIINGEFGIQAIEEINKKYEQRAELKR
jgi:hypothetical protein